MKLKNKNKAVRKIIFSLLFTFIIFVIIIDKLGITNKWLKTDNPVNSKVLVMERWIPPIYFYDIANEFKQNNYEKIIITGNKNSNSVTLFEQSSLVIKNISKYVSNSSSSKIDLILTGYWAKQEFSICKITLGDSTLYNQQVVREQKMSFDLPIANEDSLVLAFTNDAFEGRFDRNLGIEKVIINGNELNLFSKDNYVISGKANQINYFNNMRDLAAYRLIRNGIPKEKIISIEAKKSGLSRTYNNASAAVNWLKRNNIHSANIITLSFHSKRTYNSFKKASSGINFGVASINASTSKYRTIKEIVGNLFIKITPKFVLNLPRESNSDRS